MAGKKGGPQKANSVKGNEDVSTAIVEVPLLTRFVEGETSFQSDGYSKIRVTKNGVISDVTLKIKSIGIVELQAELKRETPKPPKILKRVNKDSSDGKMLGLKDDEVLQIFDTTDGDYLDQYEQFRLDFMWRTVIAALDMEWVDSDGAPVKEFKRKKKALMLSGMTGHHLDKIFSDVTLLTSEVEKNADFLSERPWG